MYICMHVCKHVTIAMYKVIMYAYSYSITFRSKQVGQFTLLVVFEFVAKWLYVSGYLCKKQFIAS